MPDVPAPAAAPAEDTPRSRLRLTPSERVPLILEAALQEFGLHGYEATRIDQIAARAGLSKGGFYAHFDSKEQVFDALIRRLLPSRSGVLNHLPRPGQSLRQVVEETIDQLSATVNNERVQVICRLMLSEGWRVAESLGTWHQEATTILLEELQAMLARCETQGLCRHGALMDAPWFLVSPFVHALTEQLLPGRTGLIHLARLRPQLIALFLELLRPKIDDLP